MPATVVWTTQMVAVLKANAFGRLDLPELATLLGVTESAVKAKAHKTGIRLTARLEPHVRSRICEYAAAGWRPSRIARQVGLDLAIVEANLPPVSSGTIGRPASGP